ncbi:hypothetical protein [Streptomyces olivaceiscleroticus]
MQHRFSGLGPQAHRPFRAPLEGDVVLAVDGADRALRMIERPQVKASTQ